MPVTNLDPNCDKSLAAIAFSSGHEYILGLIAVVN